ncbi:MAG TPA: polysaccharide deacetylase family protein [Firmicutes bacterium]|nr:polysaccharide deacetylase family protein [Bacillota bacterium]
MNRETRIGRRKKRYLYVLLFLLLLLSFFLHRQITQSVFAPLIDGAYYHVTTEDKACTLTFEVVWGPGKTAEILDILDRYNVRATFFVSGSWLRRYAGMGAEILFRGHELGQHGYEHKILTGLSDEELEQDFDRMAEALQEELQAEARLFRPPYGELDQRVYDAAHKRGLTTVIWSINANDWMGLTHAETKAKIMQELHRGAIIMMHTHSSQIVRMLPVLIESLRYAEYEILPFSELRQREIK